ncbi:uncharacterized protein RHOBADRAFT_54134 [Rhodotorula graminis WP1]|uniref:RING-type E3 ubiquitin transferase n=1 Tax=Rhodotorula graminis (strain WP1) TaxID=578459 RepID=A0A194S4E3_RHOGW|nr:uncharacterized protein RHOBADRAFT_54134 [Rhodotorula graminis WP1]KPV74291.1 hypothetical protein RHOBADRAFT_54134 [Rhodotorula graminis WP1]
MDLPLPVAQQQRIQQPQRPSISYFVFLSLLFYLMNSSQPQGNSLGLQPRDDDSSFQRRLDQQRAALLRREARAEGIARWLGQSNSSTDYLASVYYPHIANGSAPTLAPPPSSANSTTSSPPPPPSLTEAYRIPTFEPRTDGELAPVPSLVARLFADSTPLDPAGRPDARVYPHNLTGFAKGTWAPSTYTWADLGLNETWTSARRVEVPRPDSPRANETALEPERGPPSSPSPSPLARRAAQNATSANSTTTTIVVDVHNRTLSRGTYPWLSRRTSPSVRRASFNLREVQTSAVGPIEPLPADPGELDEAALLRLRDHPEAWADWEQEGPVTYLWGPLTLSVGPEDGATEDVETELDVEAVHFITSGRIYGYATPRFVRAHIVDAISLPLMSSSPRANQTAHAVGHAMLKEYRRRVAKDVRDLDDNGPRIYDDEADNEPHHGSTADDHEPGVVREPECVFSLYGALSPLPPSYDLARYAELYTSLFRPSGASTARPPPSTLSAVLSSANCGLVLSVPSARLTSTQELWLEAAHFGVLFVVAQAGALVLLVRQLERAAARPGTLANVQPLGLIMVVIVDLYVFIVTLLVGVIADSRASLPFLAGAFLALLSSVLFGLRYIAVIREATPAPSPAPAPAPAPAPTPVAPVEPGEGGEPRAEVTARDTSLAVTVFVTAITLIWHGWTPFFLWLLYSYWLPQIALNVQRGTARQSLGDEYIVGTTLARLMPPLYFWAYEGNCMMVDTTPKVYYLAAYSIAQAALLLAQSHLSRISSSTSSSWSSRYLPPGGARFFLPAGVILALDLPETTTWDYHPRTLPPSLAADLETGKGDSAAAAVEEDCPICLSPVHVHPTKAERAAGEADDVRRQAAVTPCAHVVHTECLEQWMLVRAVCPVCRAGLPPLAT